MKNRHIFYSLFCVGFYVYISAARATPYDLSFLDMRHVIVSFVVFHLAVVAHIILKELEGAKLPKATTRQFPRLGTIVFPMILSSSIAIKLASDIKQTVLSNDWRIHMFISASKSLSEKGWNLSSSFIRELRELALNEKIANVAPEFLKTNLSKIGGAKATRIALDNLYKIKDLAVFNFTLFLKTLKLAIGDPHAEEVVECLCLGLMSVICGIILIKVSRTVSNFFSKVLSRKRSRSHSEYPAKFLEIFLVIGGLMIMNFIRGPNGNNVLNFSASNSILQRLKVVVYFLATDAFGFLSPELRSLDFASILIGGSLVIWRDKKNASQESLLLLGDGNLYIPLLNFDDLSKDKEEEIREQDEQEELEIVDVPEGDMAVRTPVSTGRNSEPCQSERRDVIPSATPEVSDNDISVPKPKSRLPKKNNAKTGQSVVDVENFQGPNKSSGSRFGVGEGKSVIPNRNSNQEEHALEASE